MFAFAGQPDLQVSLRAACWGILTKRVLPGVKLLATVGSFFALNEISSISPTSLLYDIEDLDNEDIHAFVGMMQDQNQKGQKLIEDQLYEITSLGNHHLLKTPMLAKDLIKLINERKIDNKISVFEVNLTLLTRHLSFCSETKPTSRNRSRRALSNDNILHFLRFLKLFQMQVALQPFPWKN